MKGVALDGQCEPSSLIENDLKIFPSLDPLSFQKYPYIAYM